jgi:hypothetical protein
VAVGCVLGLEPVREPDGEREPTAHARRRAFGQFAPLRFSLVKKIVFVEDPTPPHPDPTLNLTPPPLTPYPNPPVTQIPPRYRLREIQPHHVSWSAEKPKDTAAGDAEAGDANEDFGTGGSRFTLYTYLRVIGFLSWQTA